MNIDIHRDGGAAGSAPSLRIPEGFPGATVGDDRSPTRLALPQAMVTQLRELAEMSFPFEACGLLIGTAGHHEVVAHEVVQARNLSSERARDRYILDPEDFLAADRSARQRCLDIVGIWHTHPEHLAVPSKTDLDAAWEGYSYLIISVDALGDTVFKSWRLAGDRFAPEAIEIADPSGDA
ncbi:MAG: M67 family metallopeptidase [Acidobacteriota bacterium]